MLRKTTSTFINKIKTCKNRGSADTLMLGILTIGFLAILLMFNYRVNSLSEIVYTVDDAMTASLLGVTLPEIHYGNLIIQDINEYETTQYSSAEKNILASEINSKFIANDIYNIAAITDVNKLANSDNFDSLVGSKKIDNSKKTSDRKLAYNNQASLELLDRLNTLMNSNILNDIENKSNTSVSSMTNIEEVKSKLKVDTDTIDSSYFSNFICSNNINISKLQLYNVFKYTFAKRHVYASPYFSYTTSYGRKINGSYNTVTNGTYAQIVKHLNSNNADITINWRNSSIQVYDKSTPWTFGLPLTSPSNNEKSFSNFISSKFPYMITPTNIPIGVDVNELKQDDFTQYYLMRYLWQLDSIAYSNYKSNPTLYPLIFYEDTGIAYTGQWDIPENPYNPDNYSDYTLETKAYSFLWCNDNLRADKILDKLVIDDSGRKVIPVENYNLYTYDLDNNKTQIQYLSGMPTIKKLNETSNINLYTTSVYVEYKYKLATFPTGGDVFRLDDFGIQDIESCRLVSVTQ